MEPKIQTSPSLLNGEGQPLTDAEIKTACPSWSMEQWNIYLQSLDGSLKESQPTLDEVARAGLASNIFEYAARSCSGEMAAMVRRLISTLTKKQRFVIKKIYFEGLSKSQIAKMMGVSRQRVFTIKKRAIRQLKINARAVVGNFPIVGAQDSANAKPEMVREGRRKGELSC